MQICSYYALSHVTPLSNRPNGKTLCQTFYSLNGFRSLCSFLPEAFWLKFILAKNDQSRILHRHENRENKIYRFSISTKWSAHCTYDVRPRKTGYGLRHGNCSLTSSGDGRRKLHAVPEIPTVDGFAQLMQSNNKLRICACEPSASRPEQNLTSGARRCPPGADIPTSTWRTPSPRRRQFAAKVSAAQSTRCRRVGCTWRADTSTHSFLFQRHRAAAGPQRRWGGLRAQSSSLWHRDAVRSSLVPTRCSKYYIEITALHILHSKCAFCLSNGLRTRGGYYLRWIYYGKLSFKILSLFSVYVFYIWLQCNSLIYCRCTLVTLEAVAISNVKCRFSCVAPISQLSL